MLGLGLGLGLSASRKPGSSVLSTIFYFSGAEEVDALTVVRSGTAATTLSEGAWVAAAANTARFDQYGLLCERQKTNKVTHKNFAPAATTGITVISGDAVVSVESDPTGTLSAATIDGHTFSALQNGSIYKITCTTASVIQLSEQAGNTNPHSWRACIASGTSGYKGTFRLSDGGGQQTITLAAANTWYEYKAENITPNNSIRYVQFNLAAGATIYVIGTQFEEDIRLSTPIIIGTAGSTATRPYDEVYFDNIDEADWFDQDNGAILWFGRIYGLENNIEQGMFGANEGNGANNQIALRTLTGDHFSEGNFKVSGTDQTTEKVGKYLDDDVYCAGSFYKDGEELRVIHGHGLTNVKVDGYTKQTATLDKLRLGRYQQYYGYADCSIEKVIVLAGAGITFKDVGNSFERGAGLLYAKQSNVAYETKYQVTSSYTNGGEVAALAALNEVYNTGRNFITNCAVGGSRYYNLSKGDDNYWFEDDRSDGPLMTKLKEDAAAVGAGNLIAAKINGFESDTDLDATEMQTALQDMIDGIHSVAPGLLCILESPGRRRDSASADAHYERWNDVHAAILAANPGTTILSPNTKVLPMYDETGATDYQHISDAGMAIKGAWGARLAADADGQSVSGPVDGPEISGAVRIGTAVTVSLSHPAGITDFTPTSGIEGFVFEDDGTPITITAASQTDATTIALTLDSQPAGTEVLKYCYDTGYSLDPANLVVGNDANTMPLQIYKGAPDVLNWLDWDGTNDGVAGQVLTEGWGTGAILPVSNNKGVFLYSENLPGSRVLSSVVTESNKTATLGTPTEIESTIKLNGGPSGVKLSETRFLYMQEEPTSNTLYLYLLDETGAEIASTTYLSGSMRYEMDAVKVTSTQVIIAYRDDSDDDLYLVSVDLTGDSFTFGTAVHVYTGTVSYPALTMQTATRGLVFIHNLVFRFTLSGSTITVGSSTRIVTADAADNYNSGIKTAFRIDDNNAIVFLQRTQTVPSYQMAAVVITDDGSTFSKSSAVNISNSMGTSTLNGEFAVELQPYISGTQNAYYLVGFQDDSTLAAFAVVVEYDGSTPIITKTPVQKSPSGANAEHVAVCLFGSGRGLIYWQDERDSVDHELWWCVISP